jgi:hypothetical protein
LGSQLVFLVLLAAPHYLAGHVRRLPFIPENETISFGAGAAVAFVFLHTLPGLAYAEAEVADILAPEDGFVPLGEIAIFLCALAGFFPSVRLSTQIGAVGAIVSLRTAVNAL